MLRARTVLSNAFLGTTTQSFDLKNLLSLLKPQLHLSHITTMSPMSVCIYTSKVSSISPTLESMNVMISNFVLGAKLVSNRSWNPYVNPPVSSSCPVLCKHLGQQVESRKKAA